MRALLRVVIPLLGLAVAAAGTLLVIEVVAAWILPPARSGLLLDWPRWRAALETTGWADDPVPAVAVGVAAAGLVLVLLGSLARRTDVLLDTPVPGVLVAASPRVLARIVGRRVRAADEVQAATVTVSRRAISVTAQTDAPAGPAVGKTITVEVESLLRELPPHRRPRVSVRVQQRRETS